MKTRLTWKETITITSMLFGMFFGAGNLIFPAFMGQMAGSNVWPAVIGFLITGVGLPLLGVAALGISRSEGLYALSCRAGKKYGMFFTCALYLTIGPLFAIPRCATVPYELGVVPMLPEGSNPKVFLAVFSVIFFALVLLFSLRPGKIMVYIGKFLNPVFLLILAVIVVTALLQPMGAIGGAPAEAGYADNALFQGFLDGYQTMDALASLAFGIVVVRVIRDLGITEPGAVAANTVRAGIFSCVAMGIIYISITVVASQSRGIFPLGANGGEVLAMISGHYFGKAGILVLASAVVMACLKTAVGLITSCAETFEVLTKGKIAYRVWAVSFCVASLLIANLGLNTIIQYSLPVLMFLYPLAIVLILLALFSRFWKDDAVVYYCVIGFTLIAAIPELIAIFPAALQESLGLAALRLALNSYLPFFSMGMGWVCPALVGLVIGLICHAVKANKEQ